MIGSYGVVCVAIGRDSVSLLKYFYLEIISAKHLRKLPNWEKHNAQHTHKHIHKKNKKKKQTNKKTKKEKTYKRKTHM